MLFVRDMRPHVMKTMPNIAPLDIMKEVGRRWSSINPTDMQKYRNLAMQDLERYKHQHQEFVGQINQYRKQAYEALKMSQTKDKQDGPKDQSYLEEDDHHSEGSDASHDLCLRLREVTSKQVGHKRKASKMTQEAQQPKRWSKFETPVSRTSKSLKDREF
jgi:hypothetical protein